jgi:predicted NAD-dependent protein-ADP-ribosyltransferase YbiA (DUF1768 family)
MPDINLPKQPRSRLQPPIHRRGKMPTPSPNRKRLSPKSSALSAWQTSALSAGATSDHLNPNSIIKPKRMPHSRNTSTSSRASTKSRSSNSSQHANTRNAKGTRSTDTYILFWGGPLSNWNLGARFSGQRALDLLLPLLDKNSAGSSYPCKMRVATHMLATHSFNCGEQWMMACKAWLFETQSYSLAREVHSALDTRAGGDFKSLRRQLMSPTEPDDDETKAFWNSSLCRILRASDPRNMKQIGRTTKMFDERKWEKLSVFVVVAGSVARAEADAKLGEIYWGNRRSDLRTTETNSNQSTTAEKQIWNTITENWDSSPAESMKPNQNTTSATNPPRLFVEGNPHDGIWGVGLSWDDKKIEDRRNWKGQNRLGTCHDEACRIYCEERAKKTRQS